VVRAGTARLAERSKPNNDAPIPAMKASMSHKSTRKPPRIEAKVARLTTPTMERARPAMATGTSTQRKPITGKLTCHGIASALARNPATRAIQAMATTSTFFIGSLSARVSRCAMGNVPEVALRERTGPR